MNLEEIFNILQIDITKDENAIKMAYRERLKVTNPEDNPEGFKRLRAAFEAACNYARTADEEPEEEEDNTPSGLWVQEAARIYSSISKRRDVEAWKKLFENELFLSLEGEELCRKKLLVFMMDNYFFPTEVWKLLDEKLNIVNDYVQLREMFPENYINYIVAKCQRGEDVDFEHFEGPDEGAYDTFIQNYLRAGNAIAEEDYPLAKQLLEEAKNLGVYHPVLALVEADIIQHEQGEIAAVDFFKGVYEKYGDDLTVAYNYASGAWKAGRTDEAAEVFLKIKEKDESHYMSNYYLARWYFDKGDYETSKKCGEFVMGSGGDDETYELMHKVNENLMLEYRRKYEEEGDIESAIELGWCLLQNSQPFEGLKLIENLKVPHELLWKYYSLLTKTYYEAVEYEKCLETALLWRKTIKEKMQGEEGEELKKDQDRIYDSYSIRTSAYHWMGYAKPEYYEKALKEAQDLSLVEELGPFMINQKAEIYYDMDKPEQTVELCKELVEKHQQFGCYALMMKAYVKLLDASGVIQASQECNYYFKQYVRAYDEAARVYFELDYPEELKELLELAKTNEVKSPYLDAYEYQLNNNIDSEKKVPLKEQLEQFDSTYGGTAKNEKKYPQGYAELTRILNEYPCTYMLIERGRYAMSGNHFEEAISDFEKVIDIKPDDQFALNNLGCIYKYTGQYEKALSCFKKAIRYMDDEPNVYPYGNLGHTYEKMGEYALAAEVYQKQIKLFPNTKAGTLSDILTNYARSGQLDTALKILDRNRDDKDFIENDIEYFRQMYETYRDAGDVENAKKAVKEAYAKAIKRGSYSNKRYLLKRVGWCELLDGNIDVALEKFNTSMIISSDDAEDYAETILFTLTIKDYLEKKKGEEKGIKGIFGKLTSGRKFDVNSLVKKLSVGRNIYGKYFYRQRYSSWLEFLEIYFTGSIEDMKAAYEKMSQTLRCRNCTNGKGCLNLGFAEALLAEKEGDYEKAFEIYEELYKNYPDDWYSLAKLIYR